MGCEWLAIGLDLLGPWSYYGNMTKLLDQAVDVARRLAPAAQDEIALAILALSGETDVDPVHLSSDERAAIARSKGAASRGEFATEDQVRSVWAKHGL